MNFQSKYSNEDAQAIVNYISNGNSTSASASKSSASTGIQELDKLLDDYESASSNVYNSYNKIAGMSDGNLSDIERFLPRYSERVSSAAEQRSTAAKALRDYLPNAKGYVDSDVYQSLLDSLDADDKDVDDMLSALSSLPEHYGQFTNDRDYQIYRQYSPIGHTSEGANTYVQQTQALGYLNQVQNGLIEEERRLRYQNAGQNGTDEVKAQLESVRQQIEDNAQQIYKLSSGLDWIAMGLGKNVSADTRKGIELSAEAYEQWVNDNKLWTHEQRLGLESLGDSADALDYYNVVDWMHKDKDRDNQIDNIRPTEKWTNEQRATFYNLFAADQETAEGYALRLNNSYAQKSMDEQTAQARAIGEQLYDGPGGKILAGVGAASLAILSAPAKVISWADKVMQTAKSGGNYVQRSTPWITDYADAMVQGRAEQINKDHPTLFGRELGEKGLGDLYQLGISIAQSMVYGNTIGEAGTLGVFFGQAADSAFNEALNRGASAEQAAIYSTLAGMAEVAGEKLSLDNLLNPNNAVFRTWWQNVLISSGIEGSEELVTNGFNRFNDFLSARLTDGQTDNQQKIQQLMQNGMSYDNASQKVWTDNVKDAAWDFLGGAISGGVSSGAQYGVRAISPYGGDEYGVSAQRIVSEGREALQRTDGTLDTNNRRLTNLTTSAQRALDNGNPISVGTAANIVRQTNRAALVNATEEQVLKSIDGIDAKDARSLANAIVSKARGETITARYKKLMDQNMDVTNRLVGNLKSPAGTWASGVGVRGIESRKYGDKAVKNMRDAANKVSDSMTVKTGDNQTGTVQEIVYDDNKVPQQLKVKTEDGTVKTVDIKDADLKEGQFDVIKTMTEQDYAADKINSMQNGQDSKAYSDQFETFAEVYGNTASGISFEDAWQAWQNSEIGKDNILTEAQARAAYQAGQDKKVSAKSGLTYRGTGRVSFDEVTDGDDTYEKPSEDEIREFKKTDRYKYLSAVAKAVGVDIVFFKTDAEGINGKYLNGRVYLAINASPSSTSIVEGYVMQTAAHELTHYIRDASPEHYLKLKDFVVKQLIDKGKLGDGKTLADLIRDKQAAYKSSGIDINVGDAIEEVVADACGMVLRDNKMLFELQKSDKALWTQVKAWLGKHLGRVKTAFDGVKAELTETQEMEAVFDELQKLWTEGAAAASKVQVGTQTETEEAKYEIKETTDGRKVAVVEDDILGNIDPSSWNDEKKRAAQKAASKAMEKFKDGIPVYGTTVRVYGRSKKELTRSRETENLYRNDKTAFADKIRTAPITDDVLYATSDWSRDGKLKHPRKDDFVDFMHGDVLISSLGRNYIAHTTVGITEDGEYVYYGINDLDVGDFEIKTSETPTAVSTQENVLDDVSGVPDRLSVPQSKRSVKSDASDSDREKAVNEFGYTPYFYDAGYILPSGKMLNFSGEKGKHYGGRGEDHRAIGIIYDSDMTGSEAMLRFMGDGNIRIMPETPGIDISSSVEPTANQYALIRRLAESSKRDGYFSIDFTDARGNVIGNLEYENIVPSKVVNDIKSFYATGAAPQQSVVSQFHYSIKQTNAYDQLQAEREARAQERSNERLARQNEILRRRWEYWKGQTKRSKQTLRSRRELRSFTNKLLRDYDSTLDRESVEKIVQQAADYFVQNDLDAFEKNGMDDAIRKLAEDIVNSADVVLDRDEAELRDRITDYLRHTSIALSDSDRAEIKHRFGGTAEFRKRGRNSAFRFSPDGRGIDSVYIELHAMFGDIFPEAISAPPDQLEYVSDVINNLNEVRGNPFSGSIDEAIDSAAADIYGFVYDTEGSVETTFADREAEKLNRQRQRIEDIMAKAAADKKAAIKKEKEAKWDKVSSVRRKDSAELRELKKQQRQRIEEIKAKAAEDKRSAVQREREAKWNKVSAVRRKYRSMIENSTDRRQRTKVRNKIKRLYSSMVTELTKPTEGRYVPKPLLRLVTDVLNSVTVDGDKGAALKAKVNELNTAYRAMSTGDNAIAYDPSIADLVSTLANEINNRGLRELSRQELEDVYNTMKAVQYTVSRATKLVTMEKQKETFEVARSLIRETEKANNVINFAPVRLFLKWTNRPLSFFRRIGGYAQDSSWVMVYNMMDKAQLYQTQLQMEASLIFEDLMKETESFNAMTDYKQLYDIGLKNRSGDAVPVTMDIALKLYMDTLAEDNARHIAFGGLTVPDIKKYYNGKASAAFAGPGVVEIRPFTSELSELRSRYNNSDIAQEREEIQAEIDALQQRADEWIAELRQNIYKQMGDYEKAWVAAAEKFFNEWSQGILNEATMRVYGFEKATVPYYVPIHTNPNFRSVSFETISKDMSLENAGFMKSRIEGAKNPILAEGLADIVSWQIDKVARYAAMMPAIRDFNKIYSVSYKSYDTSVQATVANNLHQEGLKYIENWIADLQGARARDSTFFDRLRGNLAAASLTLNPRVALAQTPSYLAAAGVVGYKPLAQALKDVADNPMLASNRDVLQEIAKYSPLMWLRMNGYFDESVKDMRESKTVAAKLNKKLSFLTNWIQTMDGLTVGQLWYAAQYYVEDNTDLERGSEEFMQRSAEMFNRIVEETQPNYTVNQRPDILREPNAVVKQLTMFMTQRLQNLNILYDAVGAYNATVRENRATGVSEERLREAKLGLARAASSQLASAAMIVCFKLAADVLTYSMKGYRDDDKELTKASVVNTLLGNFAETLAGNFLFGQEIYDVVKSMITGETYYGVSLAGVETFTDVIADFVKLTNSPSNEQLWRLCKSFTQMLGIPMNNIEKLYNAVRYRIEDAREGNGPWDFASEIELTDDQRVKKMYNAYVKGDTNTVKKLTEEIGSKAAANSGMASYIRSMFSAGRLTEGEAVEQLRKFSGMSQYDAEHDILRLRCEIETGHKYDELKKLYQAGDISKSDAIKWRSMYGDMPTEDTEKEVQQWTLKVDTGYDYDNLKTLLFDDDIAEKQAIEWSVKYGMQEEDDATTKVRKWMCEKETGYTYDDLMEHAEGGDITLDQALDWIVEYGKLTDDTVKEVEAFYSGGAITKDKLISLYKDYFEYDDLKANEVADKREFVGLNTRINDISKQTVKAYNKYCAVLDIDHDLYYDAWKEIGQLKGDVDERGKSIAGSKVKKAFAYIDTLPLTPAQKSALYMALYDNPKEEHFNKYGAPWVR